MAYSSIQSAVDDAGESAGLPPPGAAVDDDEGGGEEGEEGEEDHYDVDRADALLARLETYRDAGADWLFPEALPTRDEFASVGDTFANGPLLLANMTEFGTSPLISIPDLADLGFGAILYPVTLLRLGMKAMEAGLAVLATEGTQESMLDLMQSRQELYEMLGYDPTDPDRHLAGPAAARKDNQ